MPTLSKAIEIAARAHAERIGEDGEPEILHPIRVMLRLHADDERQVAMLHDVIEDCGLTATDLHAAGFTAEVVAAVEVLTGKTDETYEQYIKRVVQLSLAVRVKQADVEEHASVVRRLPVSAEQLERLGNYQRALVVLSAALA
jgi:(p)ppGpp synthase/HD superfamily hydrolase